MRRSDSLREARRRAFEGIDREQLAKRLNSSVNWLNQVISGHKDVSAVRAREIEKATNGKVTAKALRPDIFNLN